MGQAMTMRKWALAGASILVLSASAVWACSVPVFRYALERWAPDSYEALVIHRGPLSADDQAIVDRLRKAEMHEPPVPNIVVEVVDLDTITEEESVDRGFDDPPPKLPWLVVRYPSIGGPGPFVLSAPLVSEDVEALLDSPVRREVADRLIAGDSAVWVLLESGDAKKDGAAADLLTKELERMAEVIELPEAVEGEEAELEYGAFGAIEAGAPLKVAFSMLRLSRNDPLERRFVSMLLGTEPDLTTFDDAIVFPIFGRGRALFALVGAGITRDNILDACSFLAGPCSCQVKSLNPGTDMLMAVNWEERIIESAIPDETTPVAAELSETLARLLPVHDLSSPSETPLAAEPTIVAAVTPVATNGPSVRNTVLVILAAVVGLGLATLLIRTKKDAA